MLTSLLSISCSACLFFFMQARTTLPGTTPPTVGWASPPLIINQDSTYTDLPAGQSCGGIFSVKSPSSQICLDSCQVDKNQPARGIYFLKILFYVYECIHCMWVCAPCACRACGNQKRVLESLEPEL